MFSEGFMVQTFTVTVVMMTLDLMERSGRALRNRAADGNPVNQGLVPWTLVRLHSIESRSLTTRREQCSDTDYSERFWSSV
jgi:hypothetical protein